MFTRKAVAISATVASLVTPLLTGPGIAAADPDLDPAINTTCTYQQAMSALKAHDPATAEQFESTPAAQSWLNSFLAAPPSTRRDMLGQIQGTPEAQPYLTAMLAITGTCGDY